MTPGLQGAATSIASRRRVRPLRAAVLLLAALLLLALCLMWFEPRLSYFPMRYPAGDWTLAQRAGPADPLIQAVYLTTSDGLRIHGWLASPRDAAITAEPAAPAPVVLILHGNAGNVTHRYEWISSLARLGMQSFIIDYRGYGHSEGRPSETGLYRDAQAAWDYLVGERGISAGRIVVLGESLGGGPAVELAARVNPAALIVQSSFTSVPDVAHHYLPWLPRFLVRTQMQSVQRIGQVRCPKLFIHSRDDEIIPYALGRKLYDAAPEPREFFELRGAGHNDTCFVPGYYHRLAEFIRRAAAPASSDAPSATRPAH